MNAALTLEWLLAALGLLAQSAAMRYPNPYLTIIVVFGAINLAFALHDTEQYLDDTR